MTLNAKILARIAEWKTEADHSLTEFDDYDEYYDVMYGEVSNEIDFDDADIPEGEDSDDVLREAVIAIVEEMQAEHKARGDYKTISEEKKAERQREEEERQNMEEEEMCQRMGWLRTKNEDGNWTIRPSGK